MSRKKQVAPPPLQRHGNPSTSQPHPQLSAGQVSAMQRVLAVRAQVRGVPPVAAEQPVGGISPDELERDSDQDVDDVESTSDPPSPTSEGSTPDWQENFEPEEYGLRPQPRRNNPPPPPLPQGNVIFGPQDKLVYYGMSAIHSGSSEAEILRNERLYKVLNDGTPSPILYKRDLRALYADVLAEYDIKRLYFCPGCSRQIGTRKDRCRNRNCEYKDLKCKRSGPRRRIELVLCNVEPQLKEVMREFIDEMKELHDYIHTAKANGTLTDKSDVRFYPRYTDNIESQAEFNQNRMVVNLCLSSDGYRPKRLSKAELWPLYLRVDGANKRDRDAFRNSIISSVLFTRKTHILNLTDDFFARLIEELHDLRTTPMTVTDSVGIVWTLNFRINSGVMDLAGQRDFFKTPRWSSDMGCAKCLIPGQRIGRSRSWASGNVVHARRDAASIKRDAAVGVNGLSSLTPAMELITPDLFPVDSLHAVSEGVAQDRMKDLFDKGKFVELNLSTGDIKAVKHCVSRIVNSTYSGAYVLSIEDRSSSTGSEKQQMCNVIFPLCTSYCPSLRTRDSCVAAAMLVGFWFVSRMLEWHFLLTDASIDLIKRVARDVQFLHEELNPQSFTMKSHYFFVHGCTEELTEVGSMFAWSAAFSESWHRQFQIKHDQHATNCQIDSVKRYLSRKAIYRRFREVALRNRHPDYLALLDECENMQVNRLPVYFRVNNLVYVPAYSAVPLNRITKPEHQFFVRGRLPGSELRMGDRNRVNRNLQFPMAPMAPASRENIGYPLLPNPYDHTQRYPVYLTAEQMEWQRAMVQNKPPVQPLVSLDSSVPKPSAPVNVGNVARNETVTSRDVSAPAGGLYDVDADEDADGDSDVSDGSFRRCLCDLLSQVVQFFGYKGYSGADGRSFFSTFSDRTRVQKGAPNQDQVDEESSKKPVPPLTQMPQPVIDVLLDFGLEMIGLRDEEIFVAEHTIASLIEKDTEYWRSLGNTNEEREEKLKAGRGLAVAWRSSLERELQKAVKLIRYKNPYYFPSGVVWSRTQPSPRAIQRIQMKREHTD